MKRIPTSNKMLMKEKADVENGSMPCWKCRQPIPTITKQEWNYDEAWGFEVELRVW